MVQQNAELVRKWEERDEDESPSWDTARSMPFVMPKCQQPVGNRL